MKHLVAVVMLASLHTAAAGPLEPLWQTKAHCERASLVAWRNTLAWLDAGKVHRVDRATGKPASDVVLDNLPQPTGPSIGWSDGARVDAVVGDDVVVDGGHVFAVVDGTTGKLRWSAEQPNTDGGLPYLIIAGGDVIWIHPAHLGANDPPVFAERLALATGKRVWRADTPAHSGQISWADTDAQRLYAATEKNMIGNSVMLSAFDLATGKRLWSIEVPVAKSGRESLPPLAERFVLDHGSLIYAMGHEGLRVIDGATGKETARIAEPGVTDFSSASTVAINAGQVFVVTGDGDATAIAAFELSHGTHLWTAKTPTSGILAARSDALYVIDRDGQTLRALDPANGHELAWYGVAGSDLQFTADDARAPLFVACDGGGQLLAFDPLGTAVAPERATITGQLSCRECGKGPFGVHVGTASTKTDAQGRFKLVLEARGALNVTFDLPSIDSPLGWSGGDGHVVRFTTKRRYDLGTVRVHKDCGPISPPC